MGFLVGRTLEVEVFLSGGDFFVECVVWCGGVLGGVHGGLEELVADAVEVFAGVSGVGGHGCVSFSGVGGSSGR